MFARPISQNSKLTGSGKAIMGTRNDKVSDLLEKIQQEFPQDKVEALYHNEDQVCMLDTTKYPFSCILFLSKVFSN